MEYSIYIGVGIQESVDFLSKIGLVDDNFLDDMSSLRPSFFYPLYNDPKLFPLYKTTVVPQNSIPLVVVGHNDKSSYQMATNLSVLLVPISSGADSSCCLKSEQFGVEEFYLYRNTNISFKLKKRGTFFYALSQLKIALTQNANELASFYSEFALSFNMMPVHSFVRMPCAVSNVNSNVVVKDAPWNVVAKAKVDDKFSIISSKEQFQDLGTLPNYFFENHMMFSLFDEIDVGVEKE